MRKLFVSLALVGAVVVATQANAETAASSDAKDPNEVVCKRVYPTGSRTRATKVCATRAEWAAQASASSESVKTMQSRAGVGGGGAQNPFAPQ
jgi:hypothetical protein